VPEFGSVTLWLERLKSGDRSEAVNRLWAGYFGRMVGMARRHLGARTRGGADGEDVALSAFDSFVRAAEAGRFPRLEDRDDLWQVLFMITARKVADLQQAEGRLKRGGGQIVQSLADADSAPIAVASAEPDPAEATMLAEQAEQLLDLLPDANLRQIAVWKLEGYANHEIAQRLGRSEPTVERKLRRIREAWQGFDR